MEEKNKKKHLTPEALASLVHELSRLNGFLSELVENETPRSPVEAPGTQLASREKPNDTAHIPGQLRLTEENLRSLRDRFLSMFDVASILSSRALPWYHTQHDIIRVGTSRTPSWPILGDNFHAEPQAGTDSWAGSANLQFEAVHRKATTDPRPLLVPLRHFQLHPSVEPGAQGKIEEGAALVRTLWPNEKTRRAKRKLLGPPLNEPRSFEYQMLQWLASKDVNSEVVALALFQRGASGQFAEGPMSEDHVVSQAPASEEDTEAVDTIRMSQVRCGCPNCSQALEISPPPRDPSSAAQMWFFSGPSRWVISFPLIASILCLMSNPSKKKAAKGEEADSHNGKADRDLSRCLESMQAFCRMDGPVAGDQDLSFALGSSPDHWIYLQFHLHAFSFDSDEGSQAPTCEESGLRCDRQTATVTVRAGHNVTFRETRSWIGMRVATVYGGKTPNASPSVVGTIVSDWGRYRISATDHAWEERGLQSPVAAPGVALFQTALWSSLDQWEKVWNGSLDHVDNLLKIKADDSAGKMLDNFLQTSQTYTAVLGLLATFRQHLSMAPSSARRMRDEWTRAYPGKFSDGPDRFDHPTQKALLQNWDKVLVHLDELHGRLLGRIEKKEEEIKSLQDHLFQLTSIQLSVRNLELARNSILFGACPLVVLVLGFALKRAFTR